MKGIKNLGEMVQESLVTKQSPLKRAVRSLQRRKVAKEARKGLATSVAGGKYAAVRSAGPNWGDPARGKSVKVKNKKGKKTFVPLRSRTEQIRRAKKRRSAQGMLQVETRPDALVKR